MAGIRKVPFNSPEYFALKARREAAAKDGTKGSSPKPVVKAREKHSLFCKAPSRRGSQAPAATKINGEWVDAKDKAFDVVRPSRRMTAYKMTEKVRLPGTWRTKTITRKASVPTSLIAPRPFDRSCVRKPEVLEKLISEALAEKERETREGGRPS